MSQAPTTIPQEVPAPLVSIVMCAYNAKGYIELAVDSILRQTYTNWELIITDDGSNDGTREWLQQFETHPKIRLFFQEKNLGYVANKNFGHQQARGEYITQLDNDDLCEPDRLEKQLNALTQRPEIKIVATGYTRIDAAGKEIGRTTEPADRIIREKGVNEYPFWFPSLLVHRSVFESVGLFNTYFSGALGDDLYWTVKANERFPIWYCHEALYHYRYIETSITNVLDNRRKLIMEPVLQELFRQREIRESDWLEEGNAQALADYEKQQLNNKNFMSKQYGLWAAKAIDRQKFDLGLRLLTKAFKLWPFSFDLFRTLLYYLRRRFRAGS